MTPPYLRVAVVAPLRFPIRRPHAGGLEAAVWSEVDALRARGHAVILIAVAGSDHVEPGSVYELPALAWPADSNPTDVTNPPSLEGASVPALHRALDAVTARGVDVISNHCLHALPLRLAPQLAAPMITTLHTPVDELFVAAHRGAAGRGSSFLSVSAHTQSEWSRAGVDSRLLPNGVDPAVWRLGPGGNGLVWFGRIVPEKAPHLAIAVANELRMPMTLAGRIGDGSYFRDVIAPLLGGDVRYVGALAPDDLSDLVGRSAVALTTPVWEEPFGLVGPEALMCGTPVAGFAVGGVPEIAAKTVGMRLVRSGDIDALADAVAGLQAAHPQRSMRAEIRRRAVAQFSLGARIDALVDILTSLRAGAELDEVAA